MPILTPADHDHFLEHGYVLLRRLLTEETVAAAVSCVERWPEERRGAFWGAEDPEMVACADGTVDAAMAELFGGVAHRRDELQYKGRPITPTVPWASGGVHVDSNYPTVMPDTWAVGAFIFLTPVVSHGGALCIQPGSPRRHRSAMLDGYADYHLREARNRDGLTEVEADAGDVIVFQYNIGHSSSVNTSGETVRMAVDARYVSLDPIVPGDRPFDELSTVEKASSTRFLLSNQAMDEPAQVVASGIAEDVSAHAIMRFGGRTWRYLAMGSDARIVLRESTRDFETWTAREAVTLPGEGEGDVEALSFFAHSPGLFLAVSRGAAGTALFCTRDLDSWEEVAIMDDVGRGSVFRTSEYGGAGMVKEGTMFEAGAHGIEWRSGPTWDALGSPGARGTAVQLPPGSAARDVFVGPVVSDRSYALLVDLEVDGTTSPHAVQSPQVAQFEGPLRPLAYDGEGVPAQIRLYDRSLRWWLVGYLANVAGVSVPRWGTIDWSDEEPRLVQLETPSQLGAALATVGLR